MTMQVSREVCHNCSTKMVFELDMTLNGNHVIHCPECDHEHCRVIENGKVTGERWDSRNNLQSYTLVAGYAQSATTYTPGDAFLTQAWDDSTAGSTGSYYFVGTA